MPSFRVFPLLSSRHALPSSPPWRPLRSASPRGAQTAPSVHPPSLPLPCPAPVLPRPVRPLTRRHSRRCRRQTPSASRARFPSNILSFVVPPFLSSFIIVSAVPVPTGDVHGALAYLCHSNYFRHELHKPFIKKTGFFREALINSAPPS